LPSEADTCRRHIVPALQSAGWESEPHSIAEQRTITDGRIIPAGRGFSQDEAAEQLLSPINTIVREDRKLSERSL